MPSEKNEFIGAYEQLQKGLFEVINEEGIKKFEYEFNKTIIKSKDEVFDPLKKIKLKKEKVKKSEDKKAETENIQDKTKTGKSEDKKADTGKTEDKKADAKNKKDNGRITESITPVEKHNSYGQK